MLLLEHPHMSRQSIALFARKNGEYTRPILSKMTDVRFEDMDLQKIQIERKMMNMLAKLPDIPEANQVNKYLIVNFSICKIIDAEKANELIATNKYLILPDNPESEYWEITKRPWWEFCECYDKHQGTIKAALRPRSPMFTPDNIDERLDEFEENHGKIDVLSPITIEKMKSNGLNESLEKKLDFIFRL